MYAALTYLYQVQEPTTPLSSDRHQVLRWPEQAQTKEGYLTTGVLEPTLPSAQPPIASGY